MDIKVIVTQTVEDDGLDEVMTLEQKDVGETLQETLRYFLTVLGTMGFCGVEELAVFDLDGKVASSNDPAFT